MKFTLAMAQVNPHVGALGKNIDLLTAMAARAKQAGAVLVAFPELAICGYPPEDLLHKPLFLERLQEAETELQNNLAKMGMDAVYGTLRLQEGQLFNGGVLFANGKPQAFIAKQKLPNYGVFDEMRYFTPGHASHPLAYGGFQMGLTICEDIWHADGPAAELAAQGAQWILNLNASPYHTRKQPGREAKVRQRIQQTGLPVAYLNLVGGQDELVFDGGSFVMNPDGQAQPMGRRFGEDLRLVEISDERGAIQLTPLPLAESRPEARLPALEPESTADEDDERREIYSALCLGLRDYVEKSGFPGVTLGLSGGIDSALTAIICVDALGPERVEVVMMPSPYTSRESLTDAEEQARRMDVRLAEVSIGPLFEMFKNQLAPEFQGLEEGVTEENLQSRIRGVLLMALSNKKGSMLVTTGNKSEMSVGYATLYGDMCGGFSVLKDLLKMRVFELARARNRWAEAAGETAPIPHAVITKPPSAELRPDQKDTDSLPPYEQLDRILHLYVEQERGLKEILAEGLEREMVVRVIGLVDRNEYKRRQSAPGVRITRRAFGKDRRYPITNGFQVA
ncbi:MAG: NAD+ synthase [Magnetococcales bacterium]|nr:NAD+ synthase [Magnetococcales bacterium]